jgi:hypothetical protein
MWISSVTPGGRKYSVFEIESGRPLLDLVYGLDEPALESSTRPGEYPSGQRTAAVNRQAQPSQVRILSPPSSARSTADAPLERKLGRRGQAIVRPQRLMTVPHRPFAEAGLEIGDRIRFRADGPGRVIMERIESPGHSLHSRPSGVTSLPTPPKLLRHLRAHLL